MKRKLLNAIRWCLFLPLIPKEVKTVASVMDSLHREMAEINSHNAEVVTEQQEVIDEAREVQDVATNEVTRTGHFKTNVEKLFEQPSE